MRAVEREVAAALESVFPRISLKAFINLGTEEKYAQLDELANIVLGIRVFNHQVGKGGANTSNPERNALAILRNVSISLAADVDKTQRMCLELQEVIVQSYLRQRQGDSVDTICRWKDELTNRRQYLSYLQSLQEDMTVSERNIGSLRETLTSEMGDLQELISNRASVPKEHVYPKFYEIAAQWTALLHEYKIIVGRARTMDVLRSFCSSYTPSFRRMIQSQAAGITTLESQAQAMEAISSSNVANRDAVNSIGKLDQEVNDNCDTLGQIQLQHEGVDDDRRTAYGCKEETSKDRPEKLSIESTPEFMQLPLEYQGFCCWTIVKRQGLLLPGKPELGVIGYKNRFFVFAHQVAISAFIDEPDLFLTGTLQRAAVSPELIHLLRLQHDFPETCITRMLRGEGSARHRNNLALSAPEKRDVGTETPVHFLVRDIHSGYHWDEWTLRQRALQVANLGNCATTSQQTDVCHFRRTNDTQVYLQRTKCTQTNRSTGSKPPQHVQCFAGDMKSTADCFQQYNVDCKAMCLKGDNNVIRLFHRGYM